MEVCRSHPPFERNTRATPSQSPQRSRVLDPAEVALLQRTAGAPPCPDALLRQLAALPLDAPTYNAVARASNAYPHLFLDQHGRRMTLGSWAQAVLAGRWTAAGLGETRLQRLREVLAEVVVAG